MSDRMVDNAGDTAYRQSTADGNGSRAGIGDGIVRFVDDVVTLAELQGNLAVLNAKETLREATAPLTVIALGLILLGGSVPVVLFGIAALLATALGIAWGWALVATAVLTGVLAGFAVVVALLRLRRCLDSFGSSCEELHRNLAWLHTVLDGRDHASQTRAS